MNGILAQTGAMVVVVRIAEGETSGEGNDAITAAEATITNIIENVTADGIYTGVYVCFLSSKSKLGLREFYARLDSL